ncbi:putative cell division control protein 7 1 [Tritrichomonas foetus]|uniref:non-specific serine/threonine protein kinase n=1 Tax=Tritrichomonas foetus TaxID=1144522 RepID=A0A1J4JMB7_9EUKA|nr:putative cell division control protein 7 1 [Tritrichomonas foetus]|eukprot:OHS99841.1 putative cell division control protein 7 1 [Tritrichomonas foetus]
MASPTKLCAQNFEIIEAIGAGSFSTVYHAIHKPSGRHVALKQLFWNNSPESIVREVRFLHLLNKTNNKVNIVKVIGLFRDYDQATVVMDYIPHISFRSFLPHVTGDIIKSYMYGLFLALSHVHSQKLINRDIKPANYLYDPKSGHGCLIDFGLCQRDLHLESYKNEFSNDTYNNLDISKEFATNGEIDKVETIECIDLIHPERCQGRPKMIANRAGSHGFRAPEVLVAAFNQTPKIDIWSAGVILLSLLTQRYPFFRAYDDLSSLVEISTIIGTKRLCDAAFECGRIIKFPTTIPGVDLKLLCYQLNANIENLFLEDSVFDLLEKVLEPVPSKRLTAIEALEHPFFEPIF